MKKINEGKYWQFGWQLIEGCTRVSEGCNNCWSLAKEKRFGISPEVTFKEDRLERPLKRNKPATYAIWNDLFHPEVKFEDIDKVFSVMIRTPQHRYYILTKRPNRMAKYFQERAVVKPIENIWCGVSVENQAKALQRIPPLFLVPAIKRFVSVEPILGSVDLRISDWLCRGYPGLSMYYYLDWVICGSETGHGKRPYKIEWIESLYNQCKRTNTPFFDKQNLLGLNIRQFPK